MKRVKGILLFCILCFPFTMVEAKGSAYISVNSSVVNGNSVTATITLSNVAAWDIKGSCSGSTSGNSIHEVGDSGNGNNTTKKFYVTCKATSLGTINFNFSGDVTSSDGANTNVSGSKQVSVVKPREKSTNNNLKDLSVEGYKLTPDFNKDTLEYTVDIESSVEKIKINTKTEDGYASVNGAGEQEVEEGSNKFEIKVTSETGKEKVYTLTVNVKDSNPIVKKIDDKEYNVVKRAKSLVLPDALDKELFKLSTVKIDDNEVPAYVSEELKLTLVGLKDSDGNVYLFKVEDDKVTEKYEILTANKVSLVFTSPKEVLDGYTKTTVKIDNKEYTAYKNDKIVLLYGTNLDTNEDNWYRYDEKEKTIQIFDSSLIDELNSKEKEFNDTIQLYKYIIAGLSVLSALLFILLIISLVSKKKLKKKTSRKVDKKETIVEEPKIESKQEEVKKEISVKVEKPQEESKNDKKPKKDNKSQDKEMVKEKLDKAEKDLVEDITEEIIPSIEEIEEDLKESKSVEPDEDELVSVEDFFDLKKKKKRK